MATIARTLSEAEFLALPDDDDPTRELIRGELRERPMTARGCAYTVVSSNVGYLLKAWQRLQPRPRGLALAGDARIRLGTNPATFVGADFAHVSADSRPAIPRKARFVDGPPLLIIEIHSPSDEDSDVADKIEEYLAAGVPLVWIVSPRFSTITVHRPDAGPQLFNVDQELTAEPHLPGFRVAVADLFEDLDG